MAGQQTLLSHSPWIAAVRDALDLLEDRQPRLAFGGVEIVDPKSAPPAEVEHLDADEGACIIDVEQDSVGYLGHAHRRSFPGGDVEIERVVLRAEVQVRHWNKGKPGMSITPMVVVK